MLAVAPHRGDRQEIAELGRCTLGVQATEARRDSGVAVTQEAALAFIGVVDNLAELRRELVGGDESATAAELLCRAFARDGVQFARRLRGVYAVLVTDGLRLWSFRDHLGFRSLFYRCDGRELYVASEAKQVVAGAGIRREPDLDVVTRMFYRDTYDAVPSALRGVQRLEPAAVLESDGARTRVTPYWEPERLLETARPSDAEIQEGFDELMSRAADRVVTGEDVVLLSGGIDSPAVAAFAVEPHGRRSMRPLTALSYVYPDTPSADERTYVEEVAARLGLDLHLVQPTAKPLDDMRKWTRLADGPITVMATPLYAESYRLAASLGGRTVLTGEMAEWVMDFRFHVLPHLLAHGRLPAAVGYARALRRAGLSLRRLGREAAAPLVPGALARAKARRGLDGVPDWIDPRAINDPYAATVGWAGARWTKMQLVAFSGTSSSMHADEICQDLCGVTSRRPWVDVDLWEFFLSLPAEVKFPVGPSKTLVRRLLRGRVPDSILDRRDKTVFDASVLKSIDYPLLGELLSNRDHRLPGVDYDLLDGHLERRDMSVIDVVWAKDVASVHAFLSEF